MRYFFFKQQMESVTPEYMKRYDLEERTARRELVELVEKGMFHSEGDGKGLKYKFYLMNT